MAAEIFEMVLLRILAKGIVVQFVDFTSCYFRQVIAGVCILALVVTQILHLYLKKESSFLKWLLCSFTAAALGMFAYSVFSLCTDVPYWDDFDAFLKNYFFYPSAERVTQIAAMHNEHRIIVPRLVAEAVYQVCGHVDFKWIMYLGNAGLAGFIALVLFRFHKRSMALPWSLFICLMMSSIISEENTFWALTSVQSNYVLLFGFMSLMFCNASSRKKFLFGLFFGIVSMCSNGSGVLIWFFLLAQELKRIYLDKAGDMKFRLPCMALTAAMSLGLYFTNYSNASSGGSGVVCSWISPFRMLAYFCAFAGGAAVFVPFAIVLGVVLSVVVLLLTLNIKKVKDFPAYFFLLFMLAGGVAAAVCRHGLGIDQALSLRYRIVAVSILVMAIYLLYDAFPGWHKHLNKFMLLATYGAIVLNVSAYVMFYPVLAGKMQERLAVKRELLESGDAGSQENCVLYPNRNMAFEILKEAKERSLIRGADAQSCQRSKENGEPIYD